MKKFRLEIYVIWRIAWSEILIKYRKSFFGPTWITLNMLVTIVALSFVFSGLFGMDIYTYMPFVYCGLLSWNFISFVIQDSVLAYVNGAIKNFNFSVIFFPLKVTFKNFVVWAHNLLIYFFILLFINHEILNLKIIFFFLALPIYFLNAFSIAFIVGIISLRYRDIGEIFKNAVYLLFLITPVFWDPSILAGKKRVLVDFNPLYHMIEIMRQPMLGNIPDIQSYIWCLAVTLINIILALIVIKKNESNKALWV